MAPSNQCFLIILLISFAVVAPNLPPPSSAIRAEASSASEQHTAAAAPSPAKGREALHPEAEFSIPDLPIPALLPCPPLFPKIPLIPCYKQAPSPAPEVTECRSSLKNLTTPCAGFLTDRRAFAPPTECCAAFDTFYEDAAVLTCLCHLTNGDVAQLLPAPLRRTRVVPLLIACDFKITPNALADVCDTMKDQIPPMELPSTPPSAS